MFKISEERFPNNLSLGQKPVILSAYLDIKYLLAIDQIDFSLDKDLTLQDRTQSNFVSLSSLPLGQEISPPFLSCLISSYSTWQKRRSTQHQLKFLYQRRRNIFGKCLMDLKTGESRRRKENQEDNSAESWGWRCVPPVLNHLRVFVDHSDS